MIYSIISWAITSLGAISTYLIGRLSYKPRLWGFYISLLVQVIWLWYAEGTKQYAFIPTSFIYGTVIIINIRRNKNVKDKNN